MKKIGRILFAVGFVPIAIFIVLMCANGFGSFIELIGMYCPWVWGILGLFALMALIGIAICLVCKDRFWRNESDTPTHPIYDDYDDENR